MLEEEGDYEDLLEALNWPPNTIAVVAKDDPPKRSSKLDEYWGSVYRFAECWLRIFRLLGF